MARKLAIQLVQHGETWGRVQVVGVQIVHVDKYKGIGWKNYYRYILRCDCGKKFPMTQRQVVKYGRKKFPDCGCGIAKFDAGRVMVGLSIPLRIVRRIHHYAKVNNLTLSRAVMNQIEAPGTPFDWRTWNGEEDVLPPHCYKRGLFIGEIRMNTAYQYPSRFAAFLRRAGKLYGIGPGLVYLGILQWKWEQEMGVEDRWQKVLEEEGHPDGGEGMYLAGADEV